MVLRARGSMRGGCCWRVGDSSKRVAFLLPCFWWAWWMGFDGSLNGCVQRVWCSQRKGLRLSWYEHETALGPKIVFGDLLRWSSISEMCWIAMICLPASNP